MRVAVFRARDDGLRTAARLAQLGHQAVLAPVFEIRRFDVRLPEVSCRAVIFTSLHGVQAMPPDAPSQLRALPCFCVGTTTMACATERGFVDPRSARADAAALSDLVVSSVPIGSRLLLVGGRDRKPTIEDTLAKAGYHLIVVEAYVAASVEAWPVDVVAGLNGGIDAALHYSRRSAALAVDRAKSAGVTGVLAGVRHICLSDDVATPLRAASLPIIEIAPHPDEASLIAALGPP